MSPSYNCNLCFDAHALRYLYEFSITNTPGRTESGLFCQGCYDLLLREQAAQFDVEQDYDAHESA